MKSFRILTLLAGGTAMMAAALVGAAGAQAQSATTTLPYTLSVFPGTPPAGATQPDDLAVSADGKRLWVGYGNGVDTTGKADLTFPHHRSRPHTNVQIPKAAPK